MKNNSLTKHTSSDKDNITEADEYIIALYDKTIIDALRQLESVKRKLQELIKKK